MSPIILNASSGEPARSCSKERRGRASKLVSTTVAAVTGETSASKRPVSGNISPCFRNEKICSLPFSSVRLVLINPLATK
ncbi:hypothetical protein D3C76_1699280 [compost metagenome]